ncbi:MAG: aminotransferase class V-fold PLP-dependent enzyme [Rhodoglobus sp.]|nr:aminotransferase class V-fold PLP-dependent enzyme [Rhodoglobus sp.]
MSTQPPPPLTTIHGVPGREEFRLDPAVGHLNHGSFGAVPSRTIDYRAELTTRLEANPFRWFEELPPRHASVRAAISSFVGAPPSEIAMVANASAAASTLFASIPLRSRDEVLITDHTYGAVAMGAQRYARHWGASVRTAPVPHAARSNETLATILDSVTDHTRMVIVDHISSATARLFPVVELVEALADRDIIVAIDGAHSLGILPEASVRAERAVWFGNLHKYPCAPRGAAVLVAQGDLAQRLFPIIDSWGAELPFPERFDLQGSVDSTGFLSAAHAIDTLEEQFGWDRIRAYSAELGAWAATTIASALGDLMDVDPTPDVGMPVPQQPLLRLPPGVAADPDGARLLKNRLAVEAGCEAGVTTWSGTGFMRISAHAYNEAADYEQFLDRGIPVIASLRTGAQHV